MKKYTDLEIEQFKAKYPGCIRELRIYADDTEEPYRYLIRKPSKSLVYLLSSKEFENNMQKSSEAMISNCVLAGDMEALEHDASVYSELVTVISKLMKSARSELKKV